MAFSEPNKRVFFEKGKKKVFSFEMPEDKAEVSRGLLLSKVKKVISKLTALDFIFNEKIYLDDQGILWDVPDVQVMSGESLNGIICFASGKGNRMWQHRDTLRLVGLLLGTPVRWALLVDLECKSKPQSVDIQGKVLANFSLAGDKCWARNLIELINQLSEKTDQ